AIEPIQAFFTPCQIGVEQNARIGALVDRIARSLELLTDGGEVVDFAVEDNIGLAVGRAHRLLAPREADDRESSVPHDDVAESLLTVLVGPPVADRAVHPVQQGGFGETSPAFRVGQYESAHVE